MRIELGQIEVVKRAHTLRTRSGAVDATKKAIEQDGPLGRAVGVEFSS